MEIIGVLVLSLVIFVFGWSLLSRHYWKSLCQQKCDHLRDVDADLDRTRYRLSQAERSLERFHKLERAYSELSRS
ncbi:hypothetical protein VN12_20720 [Pirellula sp. SH-Sr6A]|nr:hypothetical protein VN12_20720 [Pirellula sp. SH-Sr6A]